MNLTFPHYSRGERIVDSCVHVLGILGSLVGMVVLLVMSLGVLPTTSTLSLLVYGSGVFAVFVCSAAYNWAREGRVKGILRRFDHAAIYVKIAATYTPFASIKIGGWAGGGLLAVVWAVALFGSTIKLLWPDRLLKTSYILYLAQGWAAVFVLGPFVNSVSTSTLVMLGIGGVLYTFGVIFHLWHTLRYHNAIWHGFVLCGSSFHFAAVMDAIVFA